MLPLKKNCKNDRKNGKKKKKKKTPTKGKVVSARHTNTHTGRLFQISGHPKQRQQLVSE